MTVWEELDLIVRRYTIGEAVAFGYFGIAQALIADYVDAVAVTR